MATTTVQFRMDNDLKQQLERIFQEMGLNMTTAMNLFAHAVVNQGRIPFDITAPKSQLENDLDDVRVGRHLSRAYTDPEELFEDLGI